MDGIGYSVKDKTERLIIECSREIDGEHTEEDTLKLMEGTRRCLKNEMNEYFSASWTAFEKRKVLAIQFEGNKWCFIEQKYHWIKVMELLLKFKELLDEQEQVTTELKKQQVGFIKVDAKDTIRKVLQ
ncbi:hypothetical protein K501DRAFT_296537 [Backusella circina FSU 941]|nr:hypothetical protein K501DRAFT_296537 [Backusella circina FSU 941]